MVFIGGGRTEEGQQQREAVRRDEKQGARDHVEEDLRRRRLAGSRWQAAPRLRRLPPVSRCT